MNVFEEAEITIRFYVVWMVKIYRINPTISPREFFFLAKVYSKLNRWIYAINLNHPNQKNTAKKTL